MNLVTVSEMRQLEQQGNQAGVSYQEMIQTVGKAIAAEIIARHGACGINVLGLVGSGNNGKDTLAAMTELIRHGGSAGAVLISGSARESQEFADFAAAGGKYQVWHYKDENETITEKLRHADVILDGIFGIGFRLPLNPEVKALNRAVRAVRRPDQAILAVDCPSGINCNSGDCDEDTLAAKGTFIIEAAKIGQLTMPAFLLLGELIPVSLKLPPSLEVAQHLKRIVLTRAVVRDLLPARPNESNKGTFGTVTVIGGSEHFPSAPLIAGKAASRSGCGLIKMVVPEKDIQIGAANLVEAIWETPDSFTADTQKQEKKGAYLIGPGMGQSAEMKDFFRLTLSRLQKFSHPVVIDADGLNFLASQPDWEKTLPEKTILTPHPGEMSRLTGQPIDTIQQNRLAVCEAEAGKRGATIILKGAITVICSPDGRTALMPYADACLAKAGSGDMLAGLIAGFAAQGCELFEAACLGVYLHAMAGNAAKMEAGQSFTVTVSDLIDNLPAAIRSIIHSPK